MLLRRPKIVKAIVLRLNDWSWRIILKNWNKSGLLTVLGWTFVSIMVIIACFMKLLTIFCDLIAGFWKTRAKFPEQPVYGSIFRSRTVVPIAYREKCGAKYAVKGEKVIFKFLPLGLLALLSVAS